MSLKTQKVKKESAFFSLTTFITGYMDYSEGPLCVFPFWRSGDADPEWFWLCVELPQLWWGYNRKYVKVHISAKSERSFYYYEGYFSLILMTVKWYQIQMENFGHRGHILWLSDYSCEVSSQSGCMRDKCENAWCFSMKIGFKKT